MGDLRKMSVEVIGTIVSAEEKAQEAVKEANAKAKEIILAMQKQCDEQESLKLEAAKAKAKEILAKAEAEAQELYNQKTEQNKAEYEALVEKSRAKVERAAEYVVGRLM